METYRDILEHHGILGQKWGVRRYRNEDGSLTAAGKKRNSEASDKKKKIAKRVAIGAAATASIIGAGYLATTMTARHKILKEGKKRSEALLKTSAGIVIGGATPQQRHAAISLKNSYMYEAGKAIDDSKKKAKEVGRSFRKSARYLYENRKKR